MPKEFDDILKKVKQELKGKTNSQTSKAYTEADFYAIATKAYKEKYGKNPQESEEVIVAENVKVVFNSYLEVLEE